MSQIFLCNDFWWLAHFSVKSPENISSPLGIFNDYEEKILPMKFSNDSVYVLIYQKGDQHKINERL